MLELLRRGVRSWVAKALLALLVVSFAVWGVGDVAAGLSTRVATVGDRAVEAEDYARTLRRALRQYQIDPARIAETGLDRAVLAQMVRDAALAEAAAEMGVSAPDAAIAARVRAEPSFRVGGEFDATRYAEAVRRAYGSVAAFEEAVRGEIARDLIAATAVQGAVPPPGAAEALARRAAEERRFEAVTLDAAAAAGRVPEPTEAQLRAHLEADAARFATPERRDVSWLHLDPAELAPRPEEAELRALYERRRDQYVRPARRTVHQLVLADQAAAEAAAELAREAGFDALLAERGLSRADAALGALTPRDLPGARGEAAFAAEAPGIVGPTQTPGGWAVLEVGDFQPEQVTPFEAVREALARELVGNAGLAEADRLAEEIADLRAAGATLEEAARELGLTLDGVQGLSREEAASREDLPDGFAEEAFAAAEGEERRLLRTPEGGWLALRVDAVEPTRPAELEEARAAVAADWRAERRRNALAETAAEAAARLEAGEDPAAVAAAFSGEAVEIGPISRDAEAPRIGAEARATLFSAQPGAVAVTVLDDEAVIARLAEVREPEGIDQQVALFRQALAQSVAEDQLQYLGYALERAAGVSLNPQTVEAAVSQVGG